MVAGIVEDFICPIPDAPDEKWFHQDLAALEPAALQRELKRAVLRELVESRENAWLRERIRVVRKALRDASV